MYQESQWGVPRVLFQVGILKKEQPTWHKYILAPTKHLSRPPKLFLV